MNEEIIIDGVDVAGCKFYEEMRELPDNLNGGYYIEHYYCNLQGDNYCICNKNPNCYFKKLKRLQEENKKLKRVTNEAKIEYENLLINRNDFAERAEKYGQALEEIRENLIKLKTNDEDDFCYEFSKLQSKIKEVLK